MLPSLSGGLLRQSLHVTVARAAAAQPGDPLGGNGAGEAPQEGEERRLVRLLALPGVRPRQQVRPHEGFRPAGVEMDATEHEPDGSWIEATLWRDNRYVTMLATMFFSAALTTVERWTRPVGARIPRPCTLALKMYCKYIGADQGPWTGWTG